MLINIDKQDYTSHGINCESSVLWIGGASAGLATIQITEYETTSGDLFFCHILSSFLYIS
ncbi:MAG: hypothetical protein LBS69_09985 [Prevotellaceae bacterium]|jgi:hypothetical protein|nr:hypothetical protein [Prevotellaceae bacterium]